MSTNTNPIPFILTFFADFCGSIGSRVPGENLNVQVVRSVDGFHVDPDNGLDVMEVTDFTGNRHFVTVDWLRSVRPAEVNLVGQFV